MVAYHAKRYTPKKNMKNQKIIYVLVLMLLTLVACAKVSVAALETDISSGVNQTEGNVITNLEVSQTELDVKARPEVDQTVSDVITQPEARRKLEAKCFRSSDETLLLINEVFSYCFQYPAQYDAFFSNTEIMIFYLSLLNATQPNLHIYVQQANGMNVEQAAEKRMRDYTVPGLESSRRDISLDGVKAIVLDGLTGQDPNRQVVVVHNDILYILYFTLMDRNQPEVYA